VEEEAGKEQFGVKAICQKLGMSRQNYYAERKRRQRKKVAGDFVAELVCKERAIHPRIGGRKLYIVLQPALKEAGIKMGRDRLFEELRQRGLLVPPLPKQWPQTTRYNASLPVFENEVKDLIITRPNEVWVSDLTYVRTDEGFIYLSLITDKYSRKIVGYHCAETLQTQETMKALEMALKSLMKGKKPIHHSDRGCQYCSHEYVGRLKEMGLGISMTEEDHCAENAMAERVNGILKQEYGIGYGFKTKEQACKAVKESIYLYNTRRLHGAINYQVPEAVHNGGSVRNN
jgi:transposase InsO family protein